MHFIRIYKNNKCSLKTTALTSGFDVHTLVMNSVICPCAFSMQKIWHFSNVCTNELTHSVVCTLSHMLIQGKGNTCISTVCMLNLWSLRLFHAQYYTKESAIYRVAVQEYTMAMNVYERVLPTKCMYIPGYVCPSWCKVFHMSDEFASGRGPF